MGKNLPSNAGDAGSIPGSEMKIPRAGATKPVCHNLGAHAAVGRNEGSCVPQLGLDAAR